MRCFQVSKLSQKRSQLLVYSLTFIPKQTIFITMPTECHTVDERSDLLDGAAKILLNIGASRDSTPATHSSSTQTSGDDAFDGTDDELNKFDCCVLDPFPLHQPSDVESSLNSCFESPSPLAFPNGFKKHFVILPPIVFFNNQSSPAMNQSSGSDTEDCTTVVNDDSSKAEVEVSTYGTPLCYRDDPSSPSVTPPGYWEKIQAAGLKKRTYETPKKSTQEILDDLDEAIQSSAEHNRKTAAMLEFLNQNNPPSSTNKKLRRSLRKDIFKWANGRDGSSSDEENEEEADSNRKETPEERCERLRDEEDEAKW
jgi:hypothetical protein